MAIKVSTGLANETADRQPLGANLKNGRLLIFSGAKPASADAASSGTLLARITDASGAFTAETRAQALLDLAGITAGETITSIKVGGLEILGVTVTCATTAAATAEELAAAINSSLTYPDIEAVHTSGTTLTLTAPKGSGTAFNAKDVTIAGTAVAAGHVDCNTNVGNTNPYTFTANFGSGAGGGTAGVAAANGLQLTFPAIAGVVSKSGVWSGLGLASGTAAWFRYCSDGADDGTTLSTSYRRIDGSVTGTGGGGDATLDNTNIAVDQTVTVTAFTFGVGRG